MNQILKHSNTQAIRPVGFFDSGIGGTCILNAFKNLCPDAETVYIADSKNCPYGNKPAEEIIRLSEANVKKLLKKNCKMIVVACNTATAAAIDYLRAKYPEIPYVGLEPAVKPAALRSKTGVVGVLATAGTFHGRLYNETKAKFAKNVTVIAAQADEFVTIVEDTVGRGRTPGGPQSRPNESALKSDCGAPGGRSLPAPRNQQSFRRPAN